MDEVEGEVFGRYRLLAVLRSGRTGTVYRAHDTMMSREVAIKVLSPELAADPGNRERFQREVSIAARLNDPNIVPIYEAGEIDGRLYLVMPAVVDGITVQDLLSRDGPLRPTVAARVIVQVASALEAAHVAGVVHGDVTTASLLVGGPFVYLIEFGAAPTDGDTVDARTDIYALTSVLYECLTGRPAVAGGLAPPKPTPKPTEVDPAIPAAFDEVVARGMAEDPDDRYQTARELSAAAHNALTAPTVPAASGPAPTTEVEFGRYRLFDKLGQGNMGAVYRAHDTALDRDVAVKLLQPELAAEPGFRERFRREAYAAGRLASPNIIPIYETGEIDGRLYLVMPIVDGVDLHKVLKRDGALSPQKAVRVVEQVAAALDAAHKSGLVHRDVKPSNLLMVGEDFVYLIDFGLVHEAGSGRLTLTNVAPGAPAYMAPERFGAGMDGKVVDARADVYSLACVLYECLTGRLPFSGGGVEGLAAAHRTGEPPKPSSFDPAIPVGFDRVIARGMAKEPDDRYQSAHELAVAARAALTDVSAHVGPPASVGDAVLSGEDGPRATAPPPRTPPKRLGRGKVLTLAVVVVAVVAAGALLRFTKQSPIHWAKPKGQVVLPFSGLDNPQRVAVDAKGNVYVTDSGNNRVLELAAGSTSQTVVPITGLDRPEDIAVDDAGDLEVTEPANHRVLELTAGSTNPIVLPFTNLGEPTGVAVDSRDLDNDRAIVVTDCEHNRVVELLGHSSEQKELPFSGLACPSAVTVGGGAFFVIDRDNERVLKLPLRATVPTVLPFMVGHPDNVAVDTSANVYVTDMSENRVTEFVIASNTSKTLPFNGINNPQGISVDAVGNVYVVDTGNNRVLKLPPS